MTHLRAKSAHFCMYGLVIRLYQSWCPLCDLAQNRLTCREIVSTCRYSCEICATRVYTYSTSKKGWGAYVDMLTETELSYWWCLHARVYGELHDLSVNNGLITQTRVSYVRSCHHTTSLVLIQDSLKLNLQHKAYLDDHLTQSQFYFLFVF